LNKLLLTLTENKENYASFYDGLDRYRKIEQSNYSSRDTLKHKRKVLGEKMKQKENEYHDTKNRYSLAHPLKSY